MGRVVMAALTWGWEQAEGVASPAACGTVCTMLGAVLQGPPLGPVPLIISSRPVPLTIPFMLCL